MSRKGFAWANNPWSSELPGQHPYNSSFCPLRRIRFK